MDYWRANKSAEANAGDNKVFYAYDARMKKHTDHSDHPECPMRIESIYKYLNSHGHLDKVTKLEVVESVVRKSKSGEKLYPALEAVHTRAEIKNVFDTSMKLKGKKVDDQEQKSLYYCNETFMAAKYGADSALSAVCQVLDEDSPQQRGFCITRPPGHHAHAAHNHGFCFFNNVALAAKLAADRGNKVLIFDWDIHQGDGTQTIFYDDDRVMLQSMHRLNFFPGGKSAYPRNVGKGKGAGYNINLGWEKEYDDLLGANEYKHACEELLLPIARQFKPDLIMISCGFDSAIHDQLGGSDLCPLAYYYMTRELLKICPKMVVVLEGGYNTDYLGQHASGVVKALKDV